MIHYRWHDQISQTTKSQSTTSHCGGPLNSFFCSSHAPASPWKLFRISPSVSFSSSDPSTDVADEPPSPDLWASKRAQKCECIPQQWPGGDPQPVHWRRRFPPHRRPCQGQGMPCVDGLDESSKARVLILKWKTDGLAREDSLASDSTKIWNGLYCITWNTILRIPDPESKTISWEGGVGRQVIRNIYSLHIHSMEFKINQSSLGSPWNSK